MPEMIEMPTATNTTEVPTTSTNDVSTPSTTKAKIKAKTGIKKTKATEATGNLKKKQKLDKVDYFLTKS
jgi:hypothetical protein